MNHQVSSWLNSFGLLILRVGIGFLSMSQHGWEKLIGFSEKAGAFPDPVGLGPQISLGLMVFAEFFCSIFIIFGFITRLSALPPVIGMLVATFIIHAEDPFSKKEFALLYAIPYLTLVFTGPGKFSLDRLIWGKSCQKANV